jgi:hypothetical protein
MGSAFSGGLGGGGTFGNVKGPRTPHPSRDNAAQKMKVLATIKRIFDSLIIDY